MANAMCNTNACGDFTVGGYVGAQTITTTTSTSGLLIDGTSLGTTTGDFTITSAGSGIISTNSNGYYGYGYDKSMISAKDGEILMDLKNMKFKVYCDEKGWLEYDMEDFSTKNKKVELNGSKDISVGEILIERKHRTVLVEKMPKKNNLLIGGGIWIDNAGTNNIYIGGVGININTTPLVYNYPNPGFNNPQGYNNTAIGIINGTSYGSSGAISSNVSNISTVASSCSSIKGNTTINGNLTINGTLTVNGGITVNGLNTSNAAITLNA